MHGLLPRRGLFSHPRIVGIGTGRSGGFRCGRQPRDRRRLRPGRRTIPIPASLGRGRREKLRWSRRAWRGRGGSVSSAGRAPLSMREISVSGNPRWRATCSKENPRYSRVTRSRVPMESREASSSFTIHSLRCQRDGHLQTRRRRAPRTLSHPPAGGAGLPSRRSLGRRLFVGGARTGGDGSAPAPGRAGMLGCAPHRARMSGTFAVRPASRRGGTGDSKAGSGDGVQGEVSSHHQGDESGRGVGDDHEPWGAGRGAVAGAGTWREAPPVHWDDAGHGVAVRRAVRAGGTAVGLVGIAVILLDTHVLV